MFVIVYNYIYIVTAWPNMLYIVRFRPPKSTHFQGFYPGPPHGFVLGSHAWPQNAYNMLATNTTNALALDARSDVGYHNPPILKRVVLDSDTKCNSLTQQAVYCPL
jgi:hypothetical protein